MKNLNKIIIRCILFISGILTFVSIYAQDTTFKEPGIPNDEKVRNSSIRELNISSYEFGLSSVILIFGFLVLCLEVYIMKASQFTSEQIIRLLSMTLIIISALFLITSAYSDTQMAPAMGLFGTLAGYLLGKTTNEKVDEKS
ncbi:hypothetical protein [Spirosoma pollinicola]|uniref:Uncharacterized protein n=1 Tax=Spirosoma pollinicola TaxID=2057025 RepID=A0A2K8Z6U8_9BACT|nr:hypothetical protein [Spirosoma pollinicola]AUD05564.1 hypothetical protein CWM47_29200 [Spirosoma pollinicola]